MLNFIWRRKSSLDIGLVSPLIEFLAILICKLCAFCFRNNKPLNANHILLIRRTWAYGNNVHESVCEYIKSFPSDNSVIELVLDRDDSILDIFASKLLQSRCIKNIVVDVRFLFTNGAPIYYPRIIWDLIILSVIAHQNGAAFFVICPDYDAPGDQLLAHILTANGGSIVSLGQRPDLVRRRCGDVRRTGPVPLIHNVSVFIPQVVPSSQRKIDLFLGGSIYGERKMLYKMLQNRVSKAGFRVFFALKEELTYQDFIKVLLDSKTTFVGAEHSSSTFRNKKFVAQGKVAEAAALGVIPVSQINPALNLWFTPNHEYLPVNQDTSVEEAADLIIELLSDSCKLDQMSSSCMSKSLLNYKLYSKIFEL